jgi:hypothetical protein
LAQRRLTAGEMVRLDLPDVAVPHPWVPFSGIWKDNPDLDAVLEHIAAERRKRDAAESDRQQEASGEQIKPGSAKHLALEHL